MTVPSKDQLVLTPELDSAGRQGRYVMFTHWQFSSLRLSNYRSPWLDERVWPAYVAAASLLSLGIHLLSTSKLLRTLHGVNATRGPEVESKTSGYIAKRGGIVIFLFKFTRSLGVIALFGLTLFTAVSYGWRASDIALVSTSVRIAASFG